MMDNIVAIGVVQSPILFLKQTDKSLAKNVDSIRRGYLLKITKIGSRFHQAYYNGKTVYAKAGSVNLIFKNSYSHTDFLKDLGKILNFQEPRLMFENTVTLSTCHNQSHRLVTPVERYLKTLGYYSGLIEEDEGHLPLFGLKLEDAIKNYQDFFLRLPSDKQDGTLKAQSPIWKSLIESTLH